MTEPFPQDFNPLLHSGPRITIMSRMVIRQRMRFAALQHSTTLTAGNLSTHLDVLVRAGYLALEVNEAKVQRSKVVLVTASGARAYEAYLAQVRAVLEGLQTALRSPPAGDP